MAEVSCFPGDDFNRAAMKICAIHAARAGFRAAEKMILDGASEGFDEWFSSQEWIDDSGCIITRPIKEIFIAGAMSQAKRVTELESEVRDMVVVIADLLKYHQTLDCCACSKCVGLSLLEKHRTQKETK